VVSDTDNTAREPVTRKDFHVKLYKTPREAVKAICIIAMRKSEMRLDMQAMLAFLAGVWVAFGGLSMISVVGGMPDFSPGIQKLAGGVVFPVALMLIMATGGELFTGNVMIFCIALADRKVSIMALARSWIVTWTCNFVGALAAAGLLGYLTDYFASPPWIDYLRALTTSKINVSWGVQVLRGAGCNMLVCLALLIGTATEDMGGKFIVALFTIGTFAIIGFEHCVANMFVLSLGLMYGAPTSVGAMMGSNIVPVTIGNVIGGAFVGLSMWYSYMFAFPGAPVPSSANIVRRFVFGECAGVAATSANATAADLWDATRVKLDLRKHAK
jgi:formate/nitrite transporter